MFVDHKKLNHTLAIDSSTRRIYRLALPLHAPEMLSSSSKSRIFLYTVMRTLRSLCLKDDTIGIYLGTSLGRVLLSLQFADHRTSRIIVDWERM